VELTDAIRQLEEAMKAHAFFDLSEPHKTITIGADSSEWTVDDDGKQLDCPVCNKIFNVKIRQLVVSPSKRVSSIRFSSPVFGAQLQRGHGASFICDQWAVCSEECEKILQLRLDGMGKAEKRQFAMLRETRKVARAAKELVSLHKPT